MINKHIFRKVNQTRKSWIVMSLALLTAIGGGTFAAHADANQNVNHSNNLNQDNNTVVKNSNQKPAVTLVGAAQQSSDTNQKFAAPASSGSQSKSIGLVNFADPQSQSVGSASSSVTVNSASVNPSLTSADRYQALEGSLASEISTRSSYITNAISNDDAIMNNRSATPSAISMASSNARFMTLVSSKAASYEASLNGSLSPTSQSDASRYIPDWNQLNPQTQSKVASLLDDDFKSYDEPVGYDNDRGDVDENNPVVAGKYIRLLKHAWFHSSAEFSQGKVLGTLHPNTTLQVLKVVHDSYGFTRYLVNINGVNGYVTANPYYAKEAYLQSPETNFYVKIHKGVNVYSDMNFNNKVSHIKRGNVVKVLRVVDFDGITRLELTNGQYITANLGWVNTNR